MNTTARMAGAVLAGAAAWLLTRYVLGVKQQQQKRVAKKLTKEAFQTWEGEGGAIVERRRPDPAVQAGL